MALRHFLTLRDLSTLELNQILQRAIELKRKQHNNEVFQPFLGKASAILTLPYTYMSVVLCMYNFVLPKY